MKSGAMSILKLALLVAIASLSAACDEPAEQEAGAPPILLNGEQGIPDGRLVAVLWTGSGEIELELFEDRAPATVRNFVELALGRKTWVDPVSLERTNRPLFEDLIFHRILPDLIQTGCPIGDGRGDPGYAFKDEFDSSLRFDRVGRVGMANNGEDDNGSQFFIDLLVQGHPEWNDKHTIFAQVTEKTLPVAQAISQVPTDERDRPHRLSEEAAQLHGITIVRKP